MSGVSGVTNQLNSTNPCPSCDCPDLTNQIQSVKGQIDPLQQAIDFEKKVIEAELNAVKQAAEIAANAAKNVAEGIGNEVKALVGLIPKPPDNSGKIEEIDRVAHQALDIAQRSYGEIVKVQQVLPIIDRTATNAQNTADRAIDLATRASAMADRAADVALDDARRIEDLEIQVRSLQDGRSPIGSTDAKIVALQAEIAALQAEIAALGASSLAAVAALETEILAVGSAGVLAAAALQAQIIALAFKPGIPGIPGAPGIPGIPGAPGAPGAAGANGVNGFNGVNGSPGINGAPGLPGAAGANGINGFNGLNGTPGINGAPGTNGAPGVNGAPGTNGSPGTNGAPGTNGKPGEKGKDAQVEFVNIDVKKFDKCEGETPKFTTGSVSVIKGTQILEQSKFERLAEIEAQICTECKAIATVPESWNYLLEGTRPQLVIIYRPVNSDGSLGKDYYPLTIPHPLLTTRPSTKPSYPQYLKGDFRGRLKLNDNSDIIVHCQSKNAATALLLELKKLVQAERLPSKDKIAITEFPAGTYKAMTAKAWRIDFYPTGRSTTGGKIEPAWTKYV